MLYILPFLILMSSAAANKVARKRLNEPMQHPQRRENLLPSNDYGMDWFTSVEQIDEESSSTLEEEIASTMEPSRQPVSSAPTAPPTSSAPTSTAPTAPPTLHPTSPFQGRDALPLASRMGCPASQRKVQFVIAVDKWGAETTWEIRRVRTDSVVLSNSRTYEPYDEERVEVCLESGSPEEEYELTLFDEVGDGICCKSGQGSYTLSIESPTSSSYERLITGGNFKQKRITHLFSVRSQSPPLSPRDEEWLVAHNIRREYWHEYYNKSYVPLKWSGELAASSKLYAEALLSTCDETGIEHDPNNKYGENMAKNKGTGGWGELYPADKVTGRFIDREVEIGYPNNYHLTQALWRASRYVGCGESEMEWKGGTCRIQVCRYSKAGNCDMNRDNWEEKMMEDDSGCGPNCPPEGCF